MALAQFIEELDLKFTQNDPLVEQIKSPTKFLQALHDLDELVGMEKVKVSVVSQIRFLLISMASGHTKCGHMLHTVIYGPPGVGKSKLGVCLAKIWLAAGLFKRPNHHPVGHDKEETIKLLRKAIESKEDIIRGLRDQHSNHLEMIRKSRSNTLRIEKTRYRSSQYKYIDSILRNLDRITDDLEHEVADAETHREEEVPFVIASAPDLVAKYVGQSAPRTRAFFEANRGGVIFIDEAYSIISDGRNSFGFESLTELNKCMSEYPDTIVQMAGYKDLMRKTVFDPNFGQPGLERRFAWVFDISNYEPEDLDSILRYQIKRDGWFISPEVDLKPFFRKHRSHFKAFGGDTEKLCFYAKQAYSNLTYEKAKTDPVKYDSTLTLCMFEEGIKLLIDNKALPEGVDDSIPLSMYM